ncbi:MAG: hypothetical protein Q9217_006616 [Psora testacea]
MSNGSINVPAAPGLAFNTNPADKPDGPPVSPIPRSASYTQLLRNENIASNAQRTDSIRRSLSENVLAYNDAERQKSTSDTTKQSSRSHGPLRRRSSSKRKTAKVSVSQFTIGPEEALDDAAYESQTIELAQTPERQKVGRSISGSISKIARRSWISASRSPPPSQSKRLSRQDKAANICPSTGPSWPVSGYEPKVPNSHLNKFEDETGNTIIRETSLPAKRSRRPLSALWNTDVGIQAPSLPAIPKSFSTEKLPSMNYNSSMVGAPGIPHAPSIERLPTAGTDSPRKRDELWSVFRSLDGEYHKQVIRLTVTFQSRPSTTKTAVVRSTLLPFLRAYSDHPSTLYLRPEDLDRRTVILNKWWTGLLEMLNGRHGESVSGNDRPAVLEAVTALMVRAEWTTPPSRPAKMTKLSLKSSRSTTSLGSNMSDFLIDSVFHNVKNTFTQNLLAQMAYVVDKMSTRNVAASVVTFCGKATAYAFFYCEGVAEILVRLWNIPVETLRRITVESCMQRSSRMEDVSENLFVAFPTCLHPLSFKGLRPMMKYLRSRPHLSIAMAYIPWHGPWVGRWAGRDTDLFFVFVKFYIDLACRLLPETISREEMAAAPGWALVQAQLLAVLDATLRRSTTQPSTDHLCGPAPSTFDEMIGEANTASTMLPLPANGLHRSMAEHRLVMLLRDCLSRSSGMGQKVQGVVAESFDTLSKAAARAISVFDHNACFTLCDFLEEAFAILNRYHQTSGPSEIEIDWPFWFQVYRRLLESHNSMTEVRLFAFIFSMWGPITSDVQRKRRLCLDWLLNPETFHSQFSHWCPMVRAFYMRLLIWRVGRLDGRNSDLNERAEKLGLARPSTAPCRPAPSRCLLIVRADVQPAPSGMFLSFEGILSSAATNKVNPYEKHSSRDLLSGESTPRSGGSVGGPQYPELSSKRRWGLLKGIIPFNTPSEGAINKSHESKTVGQPKNSFNIRANEPPLTSATFSAGGGTSNIYGSVAGSSTLSHRALSFKFSLEWVDRDENSACTDTRLSPPELPLPAQLSRQQQPSNPSNVAPREPGGAAAGSSKYAGRALAEWAHLIVECQNFFDRRKDEGVPSFQLVETPLLSVDPFRKI